MQPQLVRAAGDGMQRQKGGAFPAPENGKFGDGLLAAHIDGAQEAAAAELEYGQVDRAAVRVRHTVNAGAVGLADAAALMELAEFFVDIGVFRQQHHAEGVAVEPRDGMNAAALAGFLIVGQQAVCKRAVVAAGGGVRQKPGGLVQRDERLVLVENGKWHFLRRKALDSFLQPDGDLVAGADRVARVRGRTVYQQCVLPFQPRDQRGGHGKLPAQKRIQLSFARSGAAQKHKTAS